MRCSEWRHRAPVPSMRLVAVVAELDLVRRNHKRVKQEEIEAMTTFCLIHGSGQAPKAGSYSRMNSNSEEITFSRLRSTWTGLTKARRGMPILSRRRSKVRNKSQRTLFVSHTPRVGCISRWLPSAGYHVEWYSWLRWFAARVSASLSS